MDSLSKLNDALFAELERLENVNVADKEHFRDEVSRAKAVASLAENIVANHRTALIVSKARAEGTLCGAIQVPKMLEE